MQQLGKHTLLKWLYFLRRTLEIAASVKKITLLCCAGVWEYYERGNFRLGTCPELETDVQDVRRTVQKAPALAGLLHSTIIYVAL